MKKIYIKQIGILVLLTVLVSINLRAQDNESAGSAFIRADGLETSKEEQTGSVSQIDGKQLERYPDVLLSNSLQGLAGGLVVRMTNNGLGNNEADIFVRGLSTNGNSQAIVIIDGIERPFNDLLAEEIESIEVLKDGPAKILYGPAAANGVLVVKTRRGHAGPKVLRFGVESGIMESTRTPSYANSETYATLYNEALSNDGLAPFYQQYQIDGYHNSTGVNDVLYPNIDWYNYFTKEQSLYRKATMEAYGGNKGLKYALVGGYLGGGGFEKIGKASELNRLNIRGNLDVQVTDYLKVMADVSGRLESRTFSAINSSGMYGAISTNRPNEYPFTIPSDSLGLTPDENGIPYFGTSLRKGGNLYADMLYRGRTEERYVTSQTNVGLDFNFDSYVKGLKASGFMTFDNYSNVTSSLREDFLSYAVSTYTDVTGAEQVKYTQMTKLEPNDKLSAGSDVTRRSMGWRANLSYERSFDQHDLSAVGSYRYYKNEVKGTGQDVINCNYNLRLNYDYAKKYYIEGILSYVGANKFSAGNKFFLSRSLGAGWVMSNEDFLKGNENIDFLKIKGSYGLLGYSGNTDYLLYNTVWGDGGTISLNEGNTSNAKVVNFIRQGNPDLKWEKSTEFNVGVEGRFLNNRLKGDINYFYERRNDIIGTAGSRYGSYVGPYTMPENMGSVQNQGIDGQISYGDKSGLFEYRVGLNFTISKNKLLQWDELIQESDRQRIGKSTDAIFGMQYIGMFGRDVDMNTAPVQSFGPYGVGDLAYADRSADGMVDVRDEMQIGNNFPLSTFGLEVDLKYGNWGFYALGTSELGVNKMLNTTYHWNTGENSYSVLALERYHPVNNPGGIYPALTTTSGGNSYRNTDFWIANSSFFRMKNIELSYTLNMKQTGWMSSMRLFARGTNLFVLSEIKDLDPEVLNAGITNNPLTAFYTGGISFTF